MTMLHWWLTYSIQNSPIPQCWSAHIKINAGNMRISMSNGVGAHTRCVGSNIAIEAAMKASRLEEELQDLCTKQRCLQGIQIWNLMTEDYYTATGDMVHAGSLGTIFPVVAFTRSTISRNSLHHFPLWCSWSWLFCSHFHHNSEFLKQNGRCVAFMDFQYWCTEICNRTASYSSAYNKAQEKTSQSCARINEETESCVKLNSYVM